MLFRTFPIPDLFGPQCNALLGQLALIQAEKLITLELSAIPLRSDLKLAISICNFRKLFPSPQFGQLVQLFSDVEIQDLKVSLGLKILYNIQYLCNLKKQFKVQIIGILEETDSFY